MTVSYSFCMVGVVFPQQLLRFSCICSTRFCGRLPFKKIGGKLGRCFEGAFDGPAIALGLTDSNGFTWKLAVASKYSANKLRRELMPANLASSLRKVKLLYFG